MLLLSFKCSISGKYYYRYSILRPFEIGMYYFLLFCCFSLLWEWILCLTIHLVPFWGFNTSTVCSSVFSIQMFLKAETKSRPICSMSFLPLFFPPSGDSVCYLDLFYIYAWFAFCRSVQHLHAIPQRPEEVIGFHLELKWQRTVRCHVDLWEKYSQMKSYFSIP